MFKPFIKFLIWVIMPVISKTCIWSLFKVAPLSSLYIFPSASLNACTHLISSFECTDSFALCFPVNLRVHERQPQGSWTLTPLIFVSVPFLPGGKFLPVGYDFFLPLLFTYFYYEQPMSAKYSPQLLIPPSLCCSTSVYIPILAWVFEKLTSHVKSDKRCQYKVSVSLGKFLFPQPPVKIKESL